MKLFPLPIISAFSVILLLSGCEAGNVPQPTQNQVTPPAAVTQNTGTQAVTSQSDADVSDHQDADKTAYDGALRLKDGSLCAKITNTDLQKQCVTAVKDIQIMDEALNKNDKTICQKLSAENMRLDCEMKIEVAVAEQTKVEQTQQQMDGDAALRDQIVASGDVKRCKELTVYGHQVDCESSILTKLALEKKDKSICSQATIPDAKFNCEVVYDKSIGQ